MKNLKLKYSLLVLVAILSLFTATFSALADDDDDDDEEDRHERRERVVPAPVEVKVLEPEVKKVVEPVITTPVPIVEQKETIETRTEYVETSKTVTIPVKATQIVPDKTLIDSDNDGVSDAIDAHVGEDDFAYLIVDNNRNGIADELEKIK